MALIKPGCGDPALRRVMLVEDDPDVRQIFEMGLALGADFEVHSYPDAHAARAAFDRLLPDLILMDAVLPGESGPALIESWRATRRLDDTAVIFLTGRARPVDRRRYAALGGIGVIEKPVDPLGLLDQICRLWKARR